MSATDRPDRTADLFVIALQDAKNDDTEDTWLAASIAFTQALADAGWPEHADRMRSTSTLAEHRTACAEIAVALYPETATL